MVRVICIAHCFIAAFSDTLVASSGSILLLSLDGKNLCVSDPDVLLIHGGFLGLRTELMDKVLVASASQLLLLGVKINTH